MKTDSSSYPAPSARRKPKPSLKSGSSKSVSDLVPNENDFTGNLEDWEDRIFLNADHFRLHKFYGQGAHEVMETKDFGEAMRAAHKVLETPNHRVIVYVITLTGRFCAIPQKRWERCAGLWLTQRKGVEDGHAGENSC